MAKELKFVERAHYEYNSEHGNKYFLIQVNPPAATDMSDLMAALNLALKHEIDAYYSGIYKCQLTYFQIVFMEPTRMDEFVPDRIMERIEDFVIAYSMFNDHKPI